MIQPRLPAGLSRLAASFLAVFTVLVLPSCKNANELPAGYAIFIASSKEIMLVDSTGTGIAGPHLSQVGHRGVFIFGKVDAMKGSLPGYFLLNTATGTFEEGLNEVAWIKRLTAAGLPRRPPMGHPAAFGPKY